MDSKTRTLHFQNVNSLFWVIVFIFTRKGTIHMALLGLRSGVVSPPCSEQWVNPEVQSEDENQPTINTLLNHTSILPKSVRPS